MRVLGLQMYVLNVNGLDYEKTGALPWDQAQIQTRGDEWPEAQTLPSSTNAGKAAEHHWRGCMTPITRT